MSNSWNTRKFSRAMFPVALIGAFVGIIALLIASLIANKLQHTTIWSVRIWRWCVFMLTIFCGKFIVDILDGLQDELIWNFWPFPKVYYFARGTKKSAKVFLWLGMVCVSWFFLFDFHVKRSEDGRKVARRISKAIVGCVIGDAIWVAKTFLVRLVGFFHISKSFDKIQVAIKNRNTFKDIADSAVRTDINVTIVQQMKKEDGLLESRTIEVMVEMLRWIRGDKLSTISYHRKDEGSQDLSSATINDEKGAIQAATEIFQKLKLKEPYEEYIDKDEVLMYVDDEEVKKYFEDLKEEVDNKNCIKGSYLVQWAENFYIEHKRLMESLKYKNMAIDELDNLASVLVLIIIIIVWLLFMGFLSTQVLIFIATQLLLLTFMFGNTCKTTFESVVFVFVAHPFDIGDRVVIDDEKLTVTEMTLLSTMFLRFDNGEKLYYPHSELCSKKIGTWSPPTSDTVELDFDNSIPSDTVKQEIDKYIKQHRNEWHPIHEVLFDIEKKKWILHISHTASSYYTDIRARRKSELSLDLKDMFDRLANDIKRSANLEEMSRKNIERTKRRKEQREQL